MIIRIAALVDQDRDPMYGTIKKIIICCDLIVVFADRFGSEFSESDVRGKLLCAHVAEFLD
jgi:hypothetical protein